jgi:hypothetical protein
MKTPAVLALSFLFLLGCAKPPAPVVAPTAPTPAPVVASPVPPPDKTVALSAHYSKDGKLAFNGYVATREAIKIEGRDYYQLTIRRSGRVVRVLDRQSTTLEFGLFEFVKGRPPFLFVESFSGGANCCAVLSVYDIRAGFKTVFFDASKSISIADVDGDGTFEISLAYIGFDYYDCFVNLNSPRPAILYAFNPKKGQFAVASHRFPEFTLKEIENLKAEADEIGKTIRDPKAKRYDAQENCDLLSKVLEILLIYVFAGRRDEGWAYYNRVYTLSDREEMRAKIEKKLKADEFYRAIYPG